MNNKLGLVEYLMNEGISRVYVLQYYPGPIALVYNKKGDLEKICSYGRKGRFPIAITGFNKEEKENPFNLPQDILEKLFSGDEE